MLPQFDTSWYVGEVFWLLLTFGLLYLGVKYFGFVPLMIVCLLIVFELFVAILQAYIFTILTSIYLGQSIHSH